MTTGQIIEVGDLDRVCKSKVRGIIIEMTKEELKSFPVSYLYADTAIIPCDDIRDATVNGFDQKKERLSLPGTAER